MNAMEAAAGHAECELDWARIVRLSERLTAHFLEHHGVLPCRMSGNELLVATWRHQVDEWAYDVLAAEFERELAFVIADEHDVRTAIQRHYGEDRSADAMIRGIDTTAATVDRETAIDDLVSLANEAPVIKLVNLLVVEALEARASDVHLESYGQTLRVRYRIDGVLQDAASPPPKLAAAIISRLKIMADLDIAERRLPQDGRIRLKLQDRQVDVRVSTLPALRGESVVLRVLDKEKGRISLQELGMPAEMFTAFVDIVTRPHGICLATGPTGSGKTTTLYAAIDSIRSGREKILTVEDPVEYQLDGVPQVAVNEKVGLTFSAALRSLLRQDPDVLLVGEIRDSETAEIATQAALTGHLVLSTLHTNDSSGALARLLDLGVEAFLVASTVEGVLAQRLVRQLCAACKEPGEVDMRACTELVSSAGADLQSWVGRGCSECRRTGYRGRVGLYELLVIDDDIRRQIQRRSSASEIRRIARDRGMRTLREHGLDLARMGVTSLEEVARATR